MPAADTSDQNANTDAPASLRLLVTAGPTHEPIDSVRYLANRSSGRLGSAIADAGAARGFTVTLLLGPGAVEPQDNRVTVERFTTAASLGDLLDEHAGPDAQPTPDVVVQAAAVADFRPAPPAEGHAAQAKLRRTGESMTLELEPVPDLIARLASRWHTATGAAGPAGPRPLLVAFALEPRSGLVEAARAKLDRKGVDMIVANPLETMDAPDIDGVLIDKRGAPVSGPGPVSKEVFAGWLVEQLAERVSTRTPAADTSHRGATGGGG
jgi:phosphopantothenoylcysteine decarboxylase/phosphopantothenate--cysteine ligase